MAQGFRTFGLSWAVRAPDLCSWRRGRATFRAHRLLEATMPKYLLEVSYTLDGIRNLRAQGGSARESAAAIAAESVGGTVESFFFAFGGTDVYINVDLPDSGAAAA